jgi:hypothetical protein
MAIDIGRICRSVTSESRRFQLAFLSATSDLRFQLVHHENKRRQKAP